MVVESLQQHQHQQQHQHHQHQQQQQEVGLVSLAGGALEDKVAFVKRSESRRPKGYSGIRGRDEETDPPPRFLDGYLARNK